VKQEGVVIEGVTMQMITMLAKAFKQWRRCKKRDEDRSKVGLKACYWFTQRYSFKAFATWRAVTDQTLYMKVRPKPKPIFKT